MPRVKLYEVPFERLARLIRGYASTKELAEKLKVSYGTANSRIHKPETLTVGELRDISRRLHIPKEEILEALTW